MRKIWRIIPAGTRLRLVRMWQNDFTVSAAGIITNEKREVLLLNHVLRPYSGWGLPGGFIDHGESPESAIRRELLEETGIGLADLKLFRVRIVGKHVEILFTAEAAGEPTVRSREIIELGWFSIDRLPNGLGLSQAITIREVLTNEG